MIALSSPTNAEPRATLGVVIVNYQTPELTLRCVASMLEHGIARAQDIVVVDNDSPDRSGVRLAAELPEGVVIILSRRNGGFGAGVNIGVDALQTDLALILNPDTYFERNNMHVIRRMFDESPKLGVAGLKLVNPDGSLQYSARRFYSLPDIVARRTMLGKLGPMRRLERSHLLTRKWRQQPFEADWVMGTGFIVRRSAFEQVGRMDEGYFLYFEEVDLCARMWIDGWRVVAVPEVELVHEHQRSSAAGLLSRSGKTHLRSMARFFAKFGVPWMQRPSRARMAAALARWQAQQRDGASSGPVTEPQHGG
ncbi:MAG: glycosyltransferase family 2 protein [Burkholderiales bacterium]|nr:glycosyltransferase family 2 protein [Burkholderiales bacterium]MBH2016750.1 glycosyltransferase family 2 protein [Burkholderiales bacterium]